MSNPLNDLQKQFIQLLFNPGEKVCVAHDKAAYRSVQQTALISERIPLIVNGKSEISRYVRPSDINFISINPITGDRRDLGVTAYRSFLIEIDSLEISEQRKLIEQDLKMPFSAAIHSGNKSIHYVITLESDVDEDVYRMTAEWIHNVIDKADAGTKHPSVRCRFPDNVRHDTGNAQKLLYLGSRISHHELLKWLTQYPAEHRPVVDLRVPRHPHHFSGNLPPWIQERLEDGVADDRNKTWFYLARWLFERGWDFDEVADHFEQYFEPEQDFTQREWETCIKSAYKKVFKV